MIYFVLVVWFGATNSQTSFAVSGIESRAECERLGRVMASRYGGFGRPVQVDCDAYRAGKGR